MKMKIYQKLAVASYSIALLMTVKSAPASAEVFDFSYSGFQYVVTPSEQTVFGPPITASGVLTTDPFDPATNSYRITGITGTRNGDTITSLLPLPAISTDNLLLAGFPQLDSKGLGYSTASNPGGFKVYYGGDGSSPTGYLEREDGSIALSRQPLYTFSITPASVPEPSSMTGLLAAMGVLIGCHIGRLTDR